MDLIQLQYFLSVVKSSNFSQSADELNVSQSTISMAISRLEDELGIPLFDKHGRSKSPNAAGLMFSRRVEAIFDELEVSRTELRELFANKSFISLAIEFPDLFTFGEAKYLQQYPIVNIRQYFLPTLAVKQKLLNKDADFCVTYDSYYDSNIFSTPLLTEKMMLLVYPGHWASERTEVNLNELRNERLITMSEGFGFRKMTDRFCHEAGFEPVVPVEILDMQMLRTMIGQGVGISFITEMGWREICNLRSDASLQIKNLIAVPIRDDSCKRTAYISYLKNRVLTETAWNFYRWILDYYGKLEENNNIYNIEQKKKLQVQKQPTGK